MVYSSIQKLNLRILFFSSSQTRSGGTRQALYTAQELQKLGHDIIFIVPAKSSIIKKGPDIQWIKLPDKANLWKKTFLETVQKFQPDIVHAFHNKAVKKISWWSLLFKKKYHFLCLAHRGVVFRPNNPLPYWSPGIDCFTANSRACAKKLAGIGVPGKKIKVIYNCLPPQRVLPITPRHAILKKLGINKKKVIIGTISGDSPNKGIDVLLQAIAKIKGANIEVIIIGGTTKKWLPVCRKLNIHTFTHILGHQENIADYLQIFDIFCIPSFSESMPNTLLEATHFGLPIVASNVGGIPEVLENNGLLFPPGDSRQLTHHLKQLIFSPTLRHSLHQKSLALKKLFLPQTKARALENLYRNLISKKDNTHVG
jgi:glycosyltransferase involved in cell wall biosynthesis